MNETQDMLASLALTSAEIELYLALLTEPASIAELIERTAYHRPRIMQVLDMLIEKGLVEVQSKGRRKVYIGASPHVLIDRAKEIMQATKLVMPELLALQVKSKQSSSVRTLSGESGLSICFLDVVTTLSKHDIFYRISSAKDQQYVDSLVPAEYRTLRDGKELERRVITSQYVGEQKQNRLERSIRYFDETDEPFEHNVIQFIYGDKVSILDFNSLTAVIIDNPAIAKFYKSLFQALYTRLGR